MSDNPTTRPVNHEMVQGFLDGCDLSDPEPIEELTIEPDPDYRPTAFAYRPTGLKSKGKKS